MGQDRCLYHRLGAKGPLPDPSDAQTMLDGGAQLGPRLLHEGQEVWWEAEPGGQGWPMPNPLDLKEQMELKLKVVFDNARPIMRQPYENLPRLR